MKENKIVRLKDIAESLGTSINTVSRALKDKSDISYEMKQKVKRKAMELGYFPNIVAVSLRDGTSKVIAVVFDNLLNPYYMYMADMIATKLLNSKYATVIYRLDKGEFTMDVLFKIFSRKVDGIISFSEPNEEICNFCNKFNMPLVLVGRKNPNLNISSVYTDDFNGGYIACENLIKSNCKNVAYLGIPKNIECSVRRSKGFEQYLIDNNIKYDKNNILFLNYDNEEINDYVDRCINNHVDGIFCFNDMMALSIIKYLHTKNLLIPKDIKIVAYDYIEEKFPMLFSIPSVNSNKEKIIDYALDLLFKQINGEIANKESIEVETYLDIIN